MLQGLFNYDNPVWRFIGKLGDLILLNILWVICSLPIFTIGASTTAMYYVTLKLARDEDDSTIRSFFRSFKDNFKQATAIWLIALLAGGVIAFDLWFFSTGQMSVSGNVKNVMTAVFGGCLILYTFILSYVFPLQARFYNPVRRTILNAFFISIRHLFQTIGMIAMDVLIVVLGWFSLFYFPQLGILLYLFGVPLIAFVNSFLLNAIFKRYMPKEEAARGDKEMRPLFEEEDEETKKALEGLKNSGSSQE